MGAEPSCAVMNIFLQNFETGDYVQFNGGWTEQHVRARMFGTGMEAMMYCLEHHMHHMQVVGEFDDPGLNFYMPITDEHAAE